MRAQGLAKAIQELTGKGVAVADICGGYQMLGRVIRDPDHAESPTDEIPGLGLLPVEAVLEKEKATHQAAGPPLGRSKLAGLSGRPGGTWVRFKWDAPRGATPGWESPSGTAPQPVCGMEP